MRFAYLGLIDPSERPVQTNKCRISHEKVHSASDFRYYDAVGPETLSMLEMLRKFASGQGNEHFRPVFIDYRNMEKVLNIQSLGNLNRQFISLLRSEQETSHPIVGDPTVWESLVDQRLMRLEEALAICRARDGGRKRRFPYGSTALWVWRHPKVIVPGIELSFEIIGSFLSRKDSYKIPK
jgi:hypothetical protein